MVIELEIVKVFVSIFIGIVMLLSIVMLIVIFFL